jgi:hypothetical protein
MPAAIYAYTMHADLLLICTDMVLELLNPQIILLGPFDIICVLFGSVLIIIHFCLLSFILLDWLDGGVTEYLVATFADYFEDVKL